MARFVNPHIKRLRRNLFDALLWFLGYYAEEKARPAIPEDFIYPSQPLPFDRNLPTAVWIGHSTYFVQNGELSFLTDPVFGDYCSPFPIGALKRSHEPAKQIAELPHIDCILLSHNHYDHLEEKSILELQQRFPQLLWIVPLGLKKWFAKRGIEAVELNWWESHSFKGCQITAVPAQHFSGRGLFDKNQTLWCGYVVESKEKTFYFVGDTGYNLYDFKKIGEVWKQIDLSLIPIGAYIPRKFMEPVHISPFEAVQIHSDVASRFSLGMHWKTFRLAEEAINRPPYDLYLAMQDQSLDFGTFLPIEPGVHVNW